MLVEQAEAHSASSVANRRSNRAIVE
jgi:hypothetical protein